MSIDVLGAGSSAAGDESFSFQVDYDTVAQTIGLTCTGTGHASLVIVKVADQTVLGSLNADQYGTTQGTLVDGATVSPVTYSGARVVVLGPGATGVDSTGAALPTQTIPASVVGQFNVPKGQLPTLGITLDWGPNA